MAQGKKGITTGVVLAVAGVVAAWFVVGEIQAARARAEAARQAELAKLREAAARAEVRKQNEAAVAAGPLPELSRIDGALRVLAVRFNGDKDATMLFGLWAKNLDLCPDLVRLDDLPAPKDEFAARDRKAAEEKIIATCAQQFQAQVAKQPRVYMANCPAAEAPKYDFEKSRFVISLKKCRLVADTIWYVDTYQNLALTGASTNGVVDGNQVLLAMDEAHARDFRARLTSETQFQIAYEIGAYGETPLSVPESDAMLRALGKENRPMKGFTGRAIAFRLVAGTDTLVDWTPYGRDAEDREAKAKILTDAHR